MILLCFTFQELFEKLFSPYGGKNDRSFIYLRTFHRVRVTFDNEEKAREAKKRAYANSLVNNDTNVWILSLISSAIKMAKTAISFNVFYELR